MRSRQKVYGRKDKRIFSKTAARTKGINIPGQVISRGGTRL